jgi:hypothetical protein
MKLVPALIVAAFVLSISTHAQKAPVKFGNIETKDVAMTTYAADSRAEAVVLVDFGESTISYNQNTGFQLFFERIRRIKILKKDGMEWGDFEIPLYHDGSSGEKTGAIKGITYNMNNGEVVETKLEKSSIFREKRDNNVDIVKITFPNVREGSVIELSYTVISDFLFNFQDWDFQTTIPVKWSEYRANIPEYFQYYKNQQGYVQLAINESTATPRTLIANASQDKLDYQETRFRWVASDVPAFVHEPFMTTYKDYISKINLELASINMPNQPIKPMLGNWEEINKTFHESYQKEIKGNGFLSKIVEEVIAGATTPEEKLVAIFNYVKSNISWDQKNTKYLDRSFKKLLEEHQGNSAEINILFCSMLEKAGISSRPVLVSTRDHGLIRMHTPQSSQFNYVVALASIDGKEILFDATEKLLSIKMLPERCLNGNGFALGAEKFQWIDLETKVKTKSIIDADFVLLPSLELSGKLKLDNNGYAALTRRKLFLSKGEAEFVKDFTGSHAWELKKTNITNAAEIHNNFVEAHELTVNETVTDAGNIVYVDPFIMSGLKTNPFKSDLLCRALKQTRSSRTNGSIL